MSNSEQERELKQLSIVFYIAMLLTVLGTITCFVYIYQEFFN